MNGKGVTLLAIAVVAIGTFALPNTISMFGGQHTWYDLAESDGASGRNNVPCEKCHADVADELANSGVHRDLTCAMCHRTPFTGYTYARGHYEHMGTKPPRPGEEAHAASTVACMDCHDGAGDKGTWHYSDREYVGKCDVCHTPGWGYDAEKISAGGFGITSVPGDSGSAAAHRDFVLGANVTGEDLMLRENEACIACHTHVAIGINWTHRYKMSLDADGASGDWTVGNFEAEGTYNVTTYGNMTGETTGVSEPVIEISPEPEGYNPNNP